MIASFHYGVQLYMYVYMYNGMKWIGHPVHPKCIFCTQFWNSSLSPALPSNVHWCGTIVNMCMSHPKHYTKFSVTSEKDCLKSQCHIQFTQNILFLPQKCTCIQKQCSISTFFHEKCGRSELEAIHNQPDLSKSDLKIFITVAVLVIERLAPS